MEAKLSSFYRDMVESSIDGIWAFDAAGVTTYVNARAAEMLGYRPEELIAHPMSVVFDETGAAQFAVHLEELRAGHFESQQVEYMLIRKDGSPVWVLVSESPLHTSDGTVVGFIARLADYTDRKQLIDELRSSEAQMAEAQRIAKVGSWEWDIATNLIVGSHEYYRINDVADPASWTYDAFMSRVHPSDRHIITDQVRAAVNGAGSFKFDMRLQVRDDYMWIRQRGEIVHDQGGIPSRICGTTQDMTDPKASEALLRESIFQNLLLESMATAANEAESLEAALHTSYAALLNHPVWSHGCAFAVSRSDPGALEPVDLGADEPVVLQSHPGLPAVESALAERVLSAGHKVWDTESFPDTPSLGFPVKCGAATVAVIVITNTTAVVRQSMVESLVDQVAAQLGRVAEREQNATDLAAARDAAMAASRQKSEFLATMSHEIRTPMNGVIGLNDLLRRTELDPHQRRLAEGVHIAGRALLAVIKDILDFSKIESGKLELERVDFDIRTVIDDIANLLGESARAKGLTFLASCHPDVPTLIRGDPTRFGQVVINLASNAVKFTETGEVSIRVTVENASGPGVALRLEVSDTGIGISGEHRAAIFDPFSQADASTTRTFGGTGLGLAITAQLVTAVGGRFGVESELGQGSTFWCTARFGTAGRHEDESVSTGTYGSLDGVRALVVDDNTSSRMVVVEQLAVWGVLPVTATSADDALTRLRDATAAQRPFDVVLLDMMMPRRDGLELARAVRKDPRIKPPLLMLLTSTTLAQARQLTDLGIVECVTKPVAQSQLRTALVRHLARTGSLPAVTPTRADRPMPEGSPARHILVVEDTEVNQMVAVGILASLGFSSDIARDGQEGIEAFQRGSYAAIVMDVQMPRMDGYDATRAIRTLENNGRHIPILAMTAAALPGEREKCLASGMDDFITKPVTRDQLDHALAKLLQIPATGDPAPTAEGAAHHSSLDLERLDMLRDLADGDTSYLEKAIGNFIQHSPEAFDSVRASIERDNAAELTSTAHKLKGSALNLGVPHVADLCLELENLGDSGATEGADVLLRDLDEALTRAVTELEQYQGTV